MITIAKRFTFDSSHQLHGLPDGHKCARMHGHTYEVELQLHGRPDDRGFIVDYQEIADAWAPLHEAIDHRCLNEVPGLSNPTTEVLVIWIFDRLRGGPIGDYLSKVRVSESSTTWAELDVRSYISGRRSPGIRRLMGDRPLVGDDHP
jgi:6-pyruvoyltetrahydropterin/6-carboxytetrahydropterin synthase